MDDRRFDSLVKSLARGASRRSVLKGILGLGGAAMAGSVLLEGDASAARRPTPTPKPVKCPGQQSWDGSACVCLSPPAPGTHECGPDCCTGVPGDPPSPSHSECCDNACCHGTCYGEELCCPTNSLPGEQPPTHRICNLENGAECCPVDHFCCGVDGCCETPCSEDGHCCAPEDRCPGDGQSPNLCCVNSLTTSSICCGAGTSDNACFAAIVGVCCTDADCSDSCQICDQDTHLCVARCDLASETCCTSEEGTVECVTGECCIDAEPGCEDAICCLYEGRNACFQGDSCGPVVCPCEIQADCCYINEAFFGCIDLTQEGACCTAANCEQYNDFENCIVGACTDSTCEQRSACLADQHCCDGQCSDEECLGATQCSSDADCGGDIVCCGGTCCTTGQSCITQPDGNTYCA